MTEQALRVRDALGTPPPDLETAAELLDVTVEAFQDTLGVLAQ